MIRLIYTHRNEYRSTVIIKSKTSVKQNEIELIYSHQDFLHKVTLLETDIWKFSHSSTDKANIYIYIAMELGQGD